MRNHLYVLCFSGSLLTTALFSCNKSVPDVSSNLSALNPTNEDLNAGTWKPVLLSRPDTFAVAAPAATSSPAYAADLNTIKGYQHSLTGDQRAQIKYWSAGGVLRWNEIMRGLVAKYNLPPYQLANGTYPIPSSTNPFAYPLFPFSNPPYAARAYAYVSAAQYDALVACWHYKTLYNRPAPYTVDSSVQALAAKTSLPSYPSEGAVLAGVTAEMMQLLFPDEIASIQQKLQQAEFSLIASGAAAPSDVTAGEALGRQVADAYIARGRADNAGKAVGTPSIWSSFATATEAQGQTAWVSLETPARPPMLPLFYQVKGFLLDSTAVVALCPPPPPSTGSDTMKQIVAAALSTVQHATREQVSLVQLWADGVGTWTPPGHWNYIAAQDFVQQNWSEVRWARNFALLNMAEMDAAIECWYIKYHYFNPRPSQMDPIIRTLTGIPNFPSYVSGHSMFSGAAATILGHLIPSRAQAYMQLAQDAANSRIYAGIHYAIDCTVGLQVADEVGNYAVQRAMSDGAE
ncbi:MAG TPA: phosphatase PAP2 family protein [Puia sp.]|nr:phosphatase PAP2 family protein [Puia sp.]